MNVKEKILQLIKYCGGYEGHSFMMDERNMDNFNIILPQEKEIRERISELKFILLTGEAGDGKTRLLRNLNDVLQEQGFQVCMDFSEVNDNEKKNLIAEIKELAEGKSSTKHIVAANIGIFTKTVLRYYPELLKELRAVRDDMLIINFERRNLAADQELFQDIARSFLTFDRNSECNETDCPWRGNCVYKENLIKLTDRGMEGLRVLCDAVYLTGGHITFRELLSLISYMITFGQDCEMRKQEREQEGFRYYQIFDVVNDPRLQKFCCLDPAKARTRDANRQYGSREECIIDKRKSFFEQKDMEAEKRYELLYADYLTEFRQTLNVINYREPYFFSTMDTNDRNLVRLKLGLSKINRAGNTNLKMTVADTPSIFDGCIQTEFDISSDIETIWKRYDLDLKSRDNGNLPAGQENRFFLSYVYMEGDNLREESMLIDYPLFRFLLMAADDYHIDRNGISMEEYAVNTFYRKVLHSMPDAYRKAHIRFDEAKRKDFMNFSLELKQQNSILFRSSTKVMIEKEAEA